jgi:hypothetical protein
MLKYIAKKLLNIIFNRPLPLPSSSERILLFELQDIFRKLPVMEISTDVQPSEAEWLNNVNRLRTLVLHQDPRNFLQWDVVISTMFIVFAKYIFAELKYLKHSPGWNIRWRSAIRESSVGHPIPYVFYPTSSGNLIHHCYHIAQFEEKTKIKVDELEFVFEFGGGYGSMCRLLFNLGFRGKYVIFDLPSFSALQTYFLRSLDLPVRSINEFRTSKTGIVCISDIQELKGLLADYLQPRDSLFIATWSISESPIDIRHSVLPLVSNFQSFLIAYQSSFGEVNNLDFFDNWKMSIKNVTWHNWPIEHMPGKSHYLVGNSFTN